MGISMINCHTISTVNLEANHAQPGSIHHIITDILHLDYGQALIRVHDRSTYRAYAMNTAAEASR